MNDLIQAPPSTKTTSSLIITTLRNGYKVDELSAGLTITATPGTVTGTSISASSNIVGASGVTYTFTLKPANKLK